ncbi:MAG: Gfo/Idh/MocA family oxidoreductase [Verrucomicrobiia bacterium]
MNKTVTLSRRQFLAAAGALAAPMIIPASALGRSGRPAPSERIHLACFGFGTIAQSVTPNFLNDERVQVVAVADVNRESDHYGYQGERKGGREVGRRMVNKFYAEKTGKPNYDGCRVYEDFRELLAKEDVDAVQISTPDHWHAVMAIICARRSKHIYGQKPLAVTVEQGRAMSDAVAKAGVTWQTGSQQRSAIYFRMACEFVRNGRLGKLQRIHVVLPGGHRDFSKLGAKQQPEPVPEGLNYDLWEGPVPHRDYRPALMPLNWRWNFDYSGGMITDWGAHHIDIAQWALDMDQSGPVKIENLRADMPAPRELYNTAKTFHFECVYANGVTMVVEDESAGPNGVTFEGENGRKIFVTRGKLEFTPESLRQQKIGESEVHLYESKHHERNFVDCIYSGKPTIVPIETAHRSITIAHIANIALRLGRKKIEWDPAKERFVGDDEANKMLSRPMRRPWSLNPTT